MPLTKRKKNSCKYFSSNMKNKDEEANDNVEPIVQEMRMALLSGPPASELLNFSMEYMKELLRNPRVSVKASKKNAREGQSMHDIHSSEASKSSDLNNDPLKDVKEEPPDDPEITMMDSEDESMHEDFYQDYMYCDDDVSSLVIKQEELNDVAVRSTLLCEVCNQPIAGYRFCCVQCISFEMCENCEAFGAHDEHYMIRVPFSKTLSEVKLVVEKIRKCLSSHDGNKADESCRLSNVQTDLNEDMISRQELNNGVPSIGINETNISNPVNVNPLGYYYYAVPMNENDIFCKHEVSIADNSDTNVREDHNTLVNGGTPAPDVSLEAVIEHNVGVKEHQTNEIYVKKPLNAFMLFLKMNRDKLIGKCQNKDSAFYTSVMGRLWLSLTDDEKLPYIKKSSELRALHRKMYPGIKPNYNVRKTIKRPRNFITGPGKPTPMRPNGRARVTYSEGTKKCRAFFGLDNREKWCHPCQRKKKCMRIKWPQNSEDINKASNQAVDTQHCEQRDRVIKNRNGQPIAISGNGPTDNSSNGPTDNSSNGPIDNSSNGTTDSSSNGPTDKVEIQETEKFEIVPVEKSDDVLSNKVETLLADKTSDRLNVDTGNQLTEGLDNQINGVLNNQSTDKVDDEVTNPFGNHLSVRFGDIISVKLKTLLTELSDQLNDKPSASN